MNPFSATLRPIVSHVTNDHRLHFNSNENDHQYLYDFCRHLIETYLNVLIHLDQTNPRTDSILNGLSSFRLMYEDQQQVKENVFSNLERERDRERNCSLKFYYISLLLP